MAGYSAVEVDYRKYFCLKVIEIEYIYIYIFIFIYIHCSSSCLS